MDDLEHLVRESRWEDALQYLKGTETILHRVDDDEFYRLESDGGQIR